MGKDASIKKLARLFPFSQEAHQKIYLPCVIDVVLHDAQRKIPFIKFKLVGNLNGKLFICKLIKFRQK